MSILVQTQDLDSEDLNLDDEPEAPCADSSSCSSAVLVDRRSERNICNRQPDKEEMILIKSDWKKRARNS